MAIEEYADLYPARKAQLLRHGGSRVGDRDVTVATTWDLSLDAVHDSEPAAADLINLLAFFAPDDIDVEIITAAAEHLPPTLGEAIRDPIHRGDCIAALRRYSLVELEDDKLSVHRLVQEVTRQRLGEHGLHKWAEVAILVLDQAFEFGPDDPATWAASERVASHVEAAAAAIPEDLSSGPISSLIGETAHYRYVRASYTSAEPLMRRALEIDEAAYGPDHPEVARVLNNLAQLLQATNRLSEAEPRMRRALEVFSASHGPDHPSTQTVAGNLAVLQQAQGRDE